MTISVWRYSHLALAVSSFLFIALASVTGIVLAFEPVSQKVQPYRVTGFDELTVAQTLPLLKENFSEIIDISVDANEFVIVKAIDDDGKNIEVYVNPKTGKTLGEVGKKSEFFQWMTNLHRSLFLHEVGRFFMGLTAFLLLLIALSGTILIVKRQRGVKRFFTKIIREDFAQYYHVVLGRLTLIPIVIIALTGTYLSLVKFDVFTEQKISHKIDFDAIQSEPKIQIADFTTFKNISLSKVKHIEFPFSDDPEDYFTLKLSDKELVVNQFTGDILSEIPYKETTLFETLSLDLHTGRASAIWAIVLAIATVNILFFIYSGFAMTLKRRKNRNKNKFSKDESRFIILVGSENGSTFQFANAVYKELINKGEKVFIAEINNFSTYPKAEHLLVMTATYGLGDAPTNAKKFADLLKKHPQDHQIHFSVLGFGSHAYPDFCQFAFEANNILSHQDWANPLLEIHTVNDKSPEDYGQWLSLWSQKIEIPLSVDNALFTANHRKEIVTVTEKPTFSEVNSAFLIRLKPNKKLKFTSGDLLAIYPANDHRERQYSIGKIGDEIQLAVKLHPNGLGSEFLYKLENDDVLGARIIRNKHFHFPKKTSSVIMISNGTGIAPFLGMIDQNNKNVDCHLYCGFRSQSSFNLYDESLMKSLKSKKLAKLNIAFSREGKKQYVKDLLLLDADFIAQTLLKKGVIMICGSLSMQQNVTELLEEICQTKNGKSVSFYQSHNQILMDCY